MADPPTNNLVTVLTPEDYIPTSEVPLQHQKADIWKIDLPPPPFPPPWQDRPIIAQQYSPPWVVTGESRWFPLSDTVLQDEQSIALGRAEMLIDQLRSRLETYAPVRKELVEYWPDITLGTLSTPRRDGQKATDLDRLLIATLIIADIAPLLDDVNDPDAEPRGPTPVSLTRDEDWEFGTALRSLAPKIRKSLRRCLRAVDWEPDHWSEQVILGLLLHPAGCTRVPLMHNLGAKSGDSEFTRYGEHALSAPAKSQRRSTQIADKYRRSRGYEPPKQKRGPKPGSRSKTRAGRAQFDEYVLERNRKHGLAPSSIALDAEARRLYRAARDDPHAELTNEAVRYALRKRQYPEDAGE